MVFSYHKFNECVFKNNVSDALSSVRRALDVDRARSIRLAEDVDHNYTDKYRLANLMTNACIVSLMIVFEQLGLTKKILRSLGDTSKEITLRWSAFESCKFVGENVVDIPAAHFKETSEISSQLKDFGTEEISTKKTTIEKIVKRVTKQDYEIETEWKLSIYSGTDVDNGRVILKRKSTGEITRSIPYNPTADKSREPPPFPPNNEFPPKELSLTWLLQQIDTEELKSHFAINDSLDNPKTKTPCRNVQIEEAISFFCSVRDWAKQVHKAFAKFIRSRSPKSRLWHEHTADGIFVPVFPFLVDQNMRADTHSNAESWVESEVVESKSKVMVSLPTTDSVNNREGDSLTSPSAMLSATEMASLFDEQARTLMEMKLKLKKKYPNPEATDNLFSSLEAMVFMLCQHTKQVVDQYLGGIRYIESMLEKQLVAAIGKTVSSNDLDKFMKYHNEKFLNPCPKLFCYAIRRPEHYPDGILSIEEELDYGNKKEIESISTHVREVISKDPIMVPLNAVTTVALTGKTYLHGWLNHRFGHTPHGSIRLNARARQFSSFVLLVGTMTSRNHMQPKDAIILRNTDEIHIPLLLNEIPTATEFKDAIESLSPEQQRFAKSFRAMQLESSVLGVCVIQIKPQLEKLLGLPQDSLTKEIKLTEDLIELFVEYQVPSDLLSCDSGVVTDRKDQVANVRENVKSVLEVIASQENEQLEAQKMETTMNRLKRRGEDDEDDDEDNDLSYFGRLGFQKPIACPLSTSSSLSISSQRSASRSIPMASRRRCSKKSSQDCVGFTATAEASQSNNFANVQSMDVKPFPPDKNAQINASVDADVEFMDAKQSPANEDALVFSAIPKILDRAIELHDKNAALRSTTIKTADSNWIRTRKENLISKIPKTIRLGKDLIASEKSRAFDLLDALSRSGSLEIPFSDLHVVICATQRFEKSVMETVIEDNINPIEKLEMSTLLMASTILDIHARDLIRSGDKRKQLEGSYPLLLGSRNVDDSNGNGVDDQNDIVTNS